MASSTILRVKRRREENPLDALIVVCKRSRANTNEISPSLFMFRGTVVSQEESVIKNIVTKSDASSRQKTKHEVSILEKIRKEHKERSANNRYQVINCIRGLKQDDENENLDLVDLQAKSDLQASPRSDVDGGQDPVYEYDLYMASDRDFDVSMIDNVVSIENFVHPWGSNCCDDEDDENESDDSNDENNWRNDYPEDEEQLQMRVLNEAMEDMMLGDEELSSDEGEDNIYDDDRTYAEDKNRYGVAYAQYKLKVLQENPDLNTLQNTSSLVHSIEIKNSDSDGYKDDDSDDGFYYGQDEDTNQFKEQYD